MSHLYDDDLEDYANQSEEEFNEDQLDDEEYEKLYEALPLLRATVHAYNEDIGDQPLKEALYYNYYSVEEALAEIKDKFARKKKGMYMEGPRARTLRTPRAPRAPPESIQCAPAADTLLAVMNRSATDQHAAAGENPIAADTSAQGATPTSTPPAKPLSKLAQLAQTRLQRLGGAAAGGAAANGAAGGKLALLAAANKAKLDAAASLAKSVSILERLGRGRADAAGGAGASAATGASRLALGTHGLKRKRPPEKKPLAPTPKPPSPSPSPSPSPALVARPSFDVVYDDADLLPRAQSPLAVSLFGEPSRTPRKMRKLDGCMFEPITNYEVKPTVAKQIKTNFSEPLPDQKNLDAQSAAFEDNLKGLSLAEAQAAAPKPPPKAKATKPFKQIDLANHIAALKPTKLFVVIGHVDAGKLTLLGRMLYDVGAVDAKTLNKLTREAEKAGKGSFALAWIMDQTSEERLRGVTVDICATSFETTAARYVAIDAPGHRDFVPQMISGVAQADYALMVVDAITGSFESGFHMDGQTKEHTLLARYLGVDHVVVAVNKLDREDWSQQRFEEIRTQMTEFLTNPENDVAFDPSQIAFVPLLGLTGNNLVRRDASVHQFDWYRGPTLLEYLDAIEAGSTVDAAELKRRDFNLTVNDVFEALGSEFVVTGKVSLGLVQAGETVRMAPLQELVQVQRISVHDKALDLAMEGDVALLHFKTAHLTATPAAISAGDMVVSVDSPIELLAVFECQIKLFQVTKPLLVGTPFVLFRNNCHAQARVSQIIDKKKRKHLVSGQTATVEIRCERVFPVARYDQNKVLGRVVLRREGATIGAGQVVALH